jgi:hypothetical protein
MPVKFNHYWSIIQGKDQDYKKFIINDFIPRLNKLNIHVVAGWTVIIGGYSEIIFESVCNNLELLENALRDKRYKGIKADLLNYVKKYKTKVLIATGQKNAYTIEMKPDTVKFNQMWDVVSDKKKEYDEFTTEEFYPAIEKLGITIAREWEVLIGEGPGIICEGRVNDLSGLIGNLKSESFINAKRELKKYVENYESRVLSFHIQKVKGYKHASYKIVSD